MLQLKVSTLKYPLDQYLSPSVTWHFEFIHFPAHLMIVHREWYSTEIFYLSYFVISLTIAAVSFLNYYFLNFDTSLSKYFLMSFSLTYFGIIIILFFIFLYIYYILHFSWIAVYCVNILLSLMLCISCSWNVNLLHFPIRKKLYKCKA